MTASLYAAAQAAIAARRVLIEAGTAGPSRSLPGRAGPLVYAGKKFVAAPELSIDSALIVDAVNAFAADTDALAETLERHAPDPEAIELMLHLDADEPCAECDEGEGHLSIVCRGCFPTWEDQPAHAVWPCVEARGVFAALGLGGE